jgi:hypothetical protein
MVEKLTLIPTAYFRWVRKDHLSPTRRLEQWWTNPMHAWVMDKPEACTSGEWREVPEELVTPQAWD